MCVQAVACSGVNSHILKSLNRSSEVNSPGHKALQREVSGPAKLLYTVVPFCLLLLNACVSCPFKPKSVFRLSSCSFTAAKLKIISNAVSPFLPVKKR